MSTWLRRIRGALGMGLVWAAGWALVGVVIELAHELFPRLPLGVVDIWVSALAIPGFLCGVGFAAVLRIAEGRRRFDELSLPRFAAWGAVGGLLAGSVASALLFGNAAFGAQWLPAAAIIGTTTLLSTVSASGSLALARKGTEPRLSSAGTEAAQAKLSGRRD